jgi:hypothetical protein
VVKARVRELKRNHFARKHVRHHLPRLYIRARPIAHPEQAAGRIEHAVASTFKHQIGWQLIQAVDQAARL